MERHFEDEHERNDIRLPKEKRKLFCTKMKDIVVNIIVKRLKTVDEKKSLQLGDGGNNSIYTKRKAGGMVMDKDGLIVTASHTFGSNLYDEEHLWRDNLIVVYFTKHGSPHKYRVDKDDIYIDRSLDLAFIKSKDYNDCDFGKFNEDAIGLGKEVICISYGSNGGFSFEIGYVASLFEKSYTEVFSQGESAFQFLNEEISFWEVSGLHPLGGKSGGPIFDNRGRVIGIVLLSCPKGLMAYAITTKWIFNFMNNYKNSSPFAQSRAQSGTNILKRKFDDGSGCSTG